VVSDELFAGQVWKVTRDFYFYFVFRDKCLSGLLSCWFASNSLRKSTLSQLKNSNNHNWKASFSACQTMSYLPLSRVRLYISFSELHHCCLILKCLGTSQPLIAHHQVLEVQIKHQTINQLGTRREYNDGYRRMTHTDWFTKSQVQVAYILNKLNTLRDIYIM